MLNKIYNRLRLWAVAFLSNFHFKPKAVDNPVDTNKEAVNTQDSVVKEVEFFTRANSLRDEFFDFSPRVYGVDETIFEGQNLKCVTNEWEDDEKFVDDIADMEIYSPWEDYARFPKKVVELTPEQLKSISDGISIK